MTRKVLGLVFCGWFVCLLVHCRGTAATPRRGTTDIELDIYSGRPNPHWQPSSEEAVALDKAIESLREGAAGGMPQGGLGFRGFVIRRGDQTIRVYRHRVSVSRDDRVQIFNDTVGLGSQLAAAAKHRGFDRIAELEDST